MNELQLIQLSLDVVIEQNKELRSMLHVVSVALGVEQKHSAQGIDKSIEKFYDECRKKSGGGVTWVGD